MANSTRKTVEVVSPPNNSQCEAECNPMILDPDKGQPKYRCVHAPEGPQMRNEIEGGQVCVLASGLSANAKKKAARFASRGLSWFGARKKLLSFGVGVDCNTAAVNADFHFPIANAIAVPMLQDAVATVDFTCEGIVREVWPMGFVKAFSALHLFLGHI